MDSSLTAVSGMLQKLYAAAADPSMWTSALRDLEDVTGSAGATLVFVPKTSHAEGMVLAGRFTEDVCEEFARDQMAHCPRTAYVTRTGTSLFYDSMIMTEAQMDLDPVYHWYARLGLRYCIGGGLATNERWHINISLQRSRAQGHVDRAAIDGFLHVRGHIAQALSLAEKIGSLTNRQRASIEIFERLPQGILLLGRGKRILYANASADRTLTEGMAFHTEFGIFGLADPDLDARLDALISAIGRLAGGDASCSGGWLTVECVGALPLHLLVSPMAIDLGITLVEQPVAMVFIHDRKATHRTVPAMLAALFGLTPTEARLAGLLGIGASLESAASQLDQAVGTARIHLKSIFRKMRVDRQQDLVRLVTGLASQGFANAAHVAQDDPNRSAGENGPFPEMASS